MTSKWRTELCAAWLLVCMCGTAVADEMKLAHYKLMLGAQPNAYELLVELPGRAAPSDSVSLPQGCRKLSSSREMLGSQSRLSLGFSCSRPFAPGDAIRASWGEDGAVFTSYIAGRSGETNMVHVERGRVVLPLAAATSAQRSVPAVAYEYTGLGIVHILEGLDHLAFVLCLCLLTRGVLLLSSVTAFTLGHSVSLALAYLDVVSVPVAPVEAIIALSIVFMAREAMLARQESSGSLGQRLRYIAIVVAFGLLHGLGFASVLHDLAVSPQERVAGLIFFNVGVEIGQLLFVAAVLATLMFAKRLTWHTPLRTAALYAAGTVGLFWTIERVAGFLPGV